MPLITSEMDVKRIFGLASVLAKKVLILLRVMTTRLPVVDDGRSWSRVGFEKRLDLASDLAEKGIDQKDTLAPQFASDAESGKKRLILKSFYLNFLISSESGLVRNIRAICLKK